MILNTNNSGDNDPLDAIVIGNRFEIGDTIQAKPIAIINTLDKGKSDPKILFIHSSSPLNQINDLIITQWTANSTSDGCEAEYGSFPL